MTEIDWSHRESLRMWSVLAAQGHEGAQQVAAYHGLPPSPAPALAPPPVTASVPQAPRAVTPAAPTVALSGLDRRVAMLQRLVNPPPPPADLF